MIYFPQDETGKSRKLSHPWHGPYRIISRDDPDITVTKIYFPDDPSLQVHQSRAQHCPPSLPSEFYWYGAKRSRPGRPSKKILKQLVPLVTEIKTPSPIRVSAGTGDDNADNQLSQPDTKDKASKVKQKSKANTVLSTDDAENSTESQRCHVSLTTKKQRSGEITKQPANLCPYSLRSRNKTLKINQEARDELIQRGNDVKM